MKFITFSLSIIITIRNTNTTNRIQNESVHRIWREARKEHTKSFPLLKNKLVCHRFSWEELQFTKYLRHENQPYEATISSMKGSGFSVVWAPNSWRVSPMREARDFPEEDPTAGNDYSGVGGKRRRGNRRRGCMRWRRRRKLLMMVERIERREYNGKGREEHLSSLSLLHSSFFLFKLYSLNIWFLEYEITIHFYYDSIAF